MPHDLVRAFVTAALLAAVVGVLFVFAMLVALIWPRARQHFNFFTGPGFAEWRQERRQLRAFDQWRVIWATSRNRPVSRAALAGAQLAHVRYLQDMARRAPLVRGLLAVLAAASAFLAAGLVVSAVAQSQRRMADSIFAAVWAIYALGLGLALPWLLRRLPERMARLREQIEGSPGMPRQDGEMR